MKRIHGTETREGGHIDLKYFHPLTLSLVQAERLTYDVLSNLRMFNVHFIKFSFNPDVERLIIRYYSSVRPLYLYLSSCMNLFSLHV